MADEQLGLDALFPDMRLDDVSDQEVALFLVDTGRIKPSAELRNSMALRGQLQPILLNARTGKTQSYTVVDGRRRVAAALDLGWRSIRAYVIDVDPLVEASLAVTANAVRGDNPLSDLRSIRELSAAGYSEQEIARATGLKLAVVRKRRKLARLNAAIFEATVSGQVAIGVAERIASLPATAQAGLTGRLHEQGRITGDDVHEANSVGVAAAMEELSDLFAGPMATGPAPAPDAGSVLDNVTGAMRDLLRAYAGAIDLAGWRLCAGRAWRDETGGLDDE